MLYYYSFLNNSLPRSSSFSALCVFNTPIKQLSTQLINACAHNLLFERNFTCKQTYDWLVLYWLLQVYCTTAFFFVIVMAGSYLTQPSGLKNVSVISGHNSETCVSVRRDCFGEADASVAQRLADPSLASTIPSLPHFFTPSGNFQLYGSVSTRFHQRAQFWNSHVRLNTSWPGVNQIPAEAFNEPSQVGYSISAQR